jgi:hypothetical protein
MTQDKQEIYQSKYINQRRDKETESDKKREKEILERK